MISKEKLEELNKRKEIGGTSNMASPIITKTQEKNKDPGGVSKENHQIKAECPQQPQRRKVMRISNDKEKETQQQMPKEVANCTIKESIEIPKVLVPSRQEEIVRFTTYISSITYDKIRELKSESKINNISTLVNIALTEFIEKYNL